MRTLFLVAWVLVLPGAPRAEGGAAPSTTPPPGPPPHAGRGEKGDPKTKKGSPAGAPARKSPEAKPDPKPAGTAGEAPKPCEPVKPCPIE